jgi:hypothetical protein
VVGAPPPPPPAFYSHQLPLFYSIFLSLPLYFLFALLVLIPQSRFFRASSRFSPGCARKFGRDSRGT